MRQVLETWLRYQDQLELPMANEELTIGTLRYDELMKVHTSQ